MATADHPVLVIGGAGFIGTNLAAHLADRGIPVRIYDDLSRPGVERNLSWLREQFGSLIDAQIADVRSRIDLQGALDGVQAVFHLAAQTAVTTAISEPRHDFDVNARGTFEVLEAIRSMREPPPLIFTSTNKVYGDLPDVVLEQQLTRWHPIDPSVAANGVDEGRPLDFHTPYACSKGCADQYVLDYARVYRLPTAVFRTSCIYGPHQLGTEDQGWVAHFMIQGLRHRAITIYGDGRQVRDLLFVDDLVDAFVRAWTQIDRVRGRAFNIGGGPSNTLSVNELIELMGHLGVHGQSVQFAGWRAGDQRYYVSNTSAFTEATGWRPRVGPRPGIEALHGWLVDRRTHSPTVDEGATRG
ncbi:GDP-mannose 4,6-dehydratase [soil metagenome]